MKILYFILLSVILIQSQETFAQAIKLDDNHSLSGIPLNGNLILTSDVDSTFWISNGTASGTHQVSSVKSGNAGYAILNNKIYFAGMNAANGCELWRTDGTQAGTVLVTDIRPGADSSLPDDFVVYQNKLLFTAFTPGTGRELFMYPGSGNAAAITDLVPGSGSSFDEPLYYVLNNTLFFDAMNAAGKALYSYNGLNVQKVFDFPAGYKLNSYNAIGNMLFVFLTNGSNGCRIYTTAGTTSATLVQAFAGPFSGMFSPQPIYWNNRIFFTMAALGLNNELWVTDGNTTQMVKDINPGAEGSNPILINSVVLKNKLVFAAGTTDSGVELWSTDGTEDGTTLVKNINTNDEEGSYPILMPVTKSFTSFSSELDNADFYDRTANYNGYIFFMANDGANGTELYKTDGTAAGTVLVKDINPGSDDGVDGSYLYTKSGLLFSGNDGNGGFEPWISDGTSAGTHGIADINLAGHSNPQFYFVWNNDVYLSADDGDSDEELFDLYKLQGPYSPLPVKLGTLTATAVQQSVQLSWNTFTEINSASFEVQRSTDGSHFSKIGSVMAAGNSATEKKYSYTDLTAFAQNSATLYYRLNTIDKDGQQAYSKVVKVIVSPGKIELSVYPNPAQDVLYVSHKAGANALLQLIDMNGKVVFSSRSANANNERMKINVSGLSAGTYVVRIESEGKTSSAKFVKK